MARGNWREIITLPTLNLLKRHMEYVSIAQATTSQNIANAATPRYLAKGVLPFQEVLRRKQMNNMRTLPMQRTADSHMTGDQHIDVQFVTTPRGGEKSLNGNNVDLRHEMETASAYMDDFKQSQGIYSRMVGLMRMVITEK